MAKQPRFNPVLPDSLMAKKDRSTQEAQDEALNLPADANGELDEARLSEDAAEIEKIRDILTSNDVSGGFVRLERRGPLDQTFQYVTKIPVNQFDVDYIKTVFGGGDYRARTFRSNGQLFKPFEFSIDHRVRGSMDEAQIKQIGAGDKEAQTAVKQALDFADRIREKPDNTLPVLMKVMDSQKAQSNEMMTLITTMMAQSQQAMAQMMTGMMTAMATAMAGNKQSGPDFATTITPILIEMVKNRTSSNATMMETLEVMKALRELTGNSNGEPKDDESMMERILKIVGPVAGQMFGGRTQVSVSPAQATATPAQPQLGQPAPQPDMLIGVRLFIEQLYKAAERRSDVGLYVDLILDALTDAQLIDLQSVLTAPDWHAKLFPDVNRFQQHQVWFNDLRLALLTAIGGQPTTLGDHPAGVSNTGPANAAMAGSVGRAAPSAGAPNATQPAN